MNSTQADAAPQGTYYAPSAYDSTRPRFLKKTDNSQFGRTTRILRGNMMPAFDDAQCAEPFARFGEVYTLQDLQANKEEIREALKKPFHESIYWTTLRNPFAMLHTFTGLMLVFGVIFFVGLIILITIGLFAAGLDFFKTSGFLIIFAFASSPTIIYLIGKRIIKSGKIKDKHNIVFNRRTGMVAVPGKNPDVIEVPFDEFDAYLESSVNPSGRQVYYLVLGHRYSPTRLPRPASFDKPWGAFVEWEFLRQYMDISKPLPDIPSTEPFRSRDPVTAEYDRKHNRPPRYWRDMDLKQAEQMHNASYQAAAAYPWGLTREQALTTGWQPSGYGEGHWRTQPKDDQKSA